MKYTYANNDKAFKGDDGPLIGLLAGRTRTTPRTTLTPAGTRARITGLSAATEVDNPYFGVNKNKINEKTNRIIVNGGLDLTPFSWGHLKTNIGTDAYTNQTPDASPSGERDGGIEQRHHRHQQRHHAQPQRADAVQRERAASSPAACRLSGLVGNAVPRSASRPSTALKASNFLDPNFVSINNTLTKSDRTIITQRRLVSAFGQATATSRTTCT